MFYEAMEEVLPELEVIIDGTDGIDKVLPIKSFFEVKNNETSTDTDTNSKKGDE